ncbi:hypothetical protein OU787_23375 [Kitasatospora sp. YST-16]|uniref:hypothetical protein n=1 Tax=Kitasatospora sp. YST-16 TaxID=2998080 RepID=UPI0022840291|nr:hypothetical protein [Kitasatospora sp. YST-16]WAL74176.1 hypothetical protein OU787_23375 [Kitasatospora sp. YST-16]
MPQQSQQFAHGPAAAEEKAERRRLDLTAAQVAASALAAVAGAVLASELGVYGTILGAAVVSVGATVGSALFQHLFKRTGEQLRNAVERGTESAPAVHPAPAPPNGISQDWNAPRLLRAKRRWTWKSYAAVSGLVFVLAMVPIVAVELAAGKPMHDITTGQDGGGTSFNPSRPSGDRQPQAPADTPSAGPSDLPSGRSSATPRRRRAVRPGRRRPRRVRRPGRRPRRPRRAPGPPARPRPTGPRRRPRNRRRARARARARRTRCPGRPRRPAPAEAAEGQAPSTRRR